MKFYYTKKHSKWELILFFFLLFVALIGILITCLYSGYRPASAALAGEEKKDYITYVEFNVPYAALDRALQYDIDTHDSDNPLDWVCLLAYLGAKYYGDFSLYRSADLDKLVSRLQSGDSLEKLTAEMVYYAYYEEAYRAVLGGLTGYYRREIPLDSGGTQWKEGYGLRAFSPIAENFYYEHYDDFGAQRTYGYKRQHLGHDMMAEIGTPVIAIESGVVESLGWNEYGGWRIGIRSHDQKRYYYYAHLRQNRPYAAGLAEGDLVLAGDVIGYVGHTGYSTTENVNNIKVSHLHWGMQLIFDESQKESDHEIWIDVYALSQLLAQNRSSVYRVAETKEFYRVYQMEKLP